MEITWTVIKFIEEDSVEAVPTSWLLGSTKCYWPPFSKEKLLGSIRKHEKPNTCWPIHEIVVFKNGTFDDYVTARAKARKAEYHSDLASDTDKRNRKLKKRKYISSSDEEEVISSKLPEPPKMPKVPQEPGIEREETELSTIIAARTSPTNISISSCSCCLLHNMGDSIKPLVKQQVLTRHILNEVLEEIKQLRTEFKNNNHPAKQRDVISIFVEFEHFPVDCNENMNLLEDYLGDVSKFKAAVNEISKIGGSNVYDFVKRCLSCMLTNGFASEYSWYGAKKKKVFGKLKLAELLLEAADLSTLTENRKATEEAIKSWLRRAKERHLSLSKKKDQTPEGENSTLFSN